jgi:hypothetical protein
VALAYDAPHKEALSKEQDQAQREEKLVRMLKAEEEDSLGYAQTEVQEQQMEALRRYFGEKYGDEEDGRSQVITREVFETIEWQRNDYARVLNDGGKLIYAEESREEYAKQARAAEDYMQWIVFSDNPGFFLLDDFTFDGLLHRRGYLGAYWRTKEYRAPQSLTGLNIMQVQELMNDPEIEIVGQDFDGESEAGGINLIVRRLKSPARLEIVSFAPEDVRLNGRSTDIDGGRYLGLVWRKLRGEIMREWEHKAAEIMAWSGGESAAGGAVRRSDDVRSERFQDDDVKWNEAADEASEELEVLEEYLRVDLDGDGYPELIRSYRLGDIILEEGEVEENPLGTWTPTRIPHRFMGLSVHDTTADLQRQSTVLTRAGLDAVYQSVVNREAFDKNKVEADGAINSTYTGTKIPVDGDPAGAILPLVGGLNTATVAWEALEIIKQRIEDRTGATRQTRGLDSDQLSKEHSGKALGMLQLNADARKEMTARNLAAGLSAFASKIYRIVCRNQNEPRQAKIGGQYCTFDPRTWNSDIKMSFHVAGLNREHSLVGLRLIGEEQEKVIETLGPGNPNVTVKNRYRYQEELVRFAGQRDTAAFFTEIPDQPEMGPDGQPVVDPQTGQPKMKPWAPEPQPDPAMAKVQADAQAKQAEMQLKGQESQAQMQLKTEEAKAGLQLQGQKDSAALAHEEQKAALTLELAREKAAAELQLAEGKARAEIELAWAKFEAEMALAREKQAAEIAMQRETMAHQREMHSEDTQNKREMHSEKVEADVKISKNREGGSLSE